MTFTISCLLISILFFMLRLLYDVYYMTFMIFRLLCYVCYVTFIILRDMSITHINIDTYCTHTVTDIAIYNVIYIKLIFVGSHI
jgi:hypothetical protein